MIKQLFVLFFVFFSFLAFGQEVYYTNPVKIPMLLSGSFGELRNNHFHSGIDIKTQGNINIPVYNVAEGYISRIVVSPTGYGKAIYINHDNGTTSVYGHLNLFRPDIDEYVKKIQYEKKSFKIDVPVLPGVFELQKNEMFAMSGNSGSSQAPHLHFELRNTRSEHPINPLKLGFWIKDTTPPKITGLQITPITDD
jgi:murein DD-endopeptidase MepM/ murein hydrolase activator NlpD